MFGADRSEIIGHRCHKYLCPTDEFNCPIIDKNQTVEQSERMFVNASGEMIPIIKTVKRITMDGRPVLLESFTDITSLKEAEEKLRTLEIVEEANKAKTDFLSNMSHEMRTPMNAIIGMTAIGKSASDAEHKDYALKKIEDASTHLLGIINDVLDLAKIESGHFELSTAEFSLEKMLQRVVTVVSFRVSEKDQNFTLYIDKDIPPVLIGDDQRLAQIITNLLGNAIKFTPNEGAVRLDVRLIEKEGDAVKIRFEITDSGIGISPEQQGRIFQSYKQAEADTTRKYGGTGLGLSISKNIVEMMGGDIWVESELGKGATFAFSVQMKSGDSKKFEEMVRAINWKNIRILAVDDDVGISGYIKNFVEDYGAVCDTAVCGDEALDLVLGNEGYNIFFVDIKLPDIDGFSLIRQLKAMDSDRARTAVIMLSTVEWHDIEARAKEAGVDAFLPKPLFPSAIEEIVNSFLGVVRDRIDETAADAEITYKGKRVLLVEDIEINREIALSLLEPTLLEIDCAEDGEEAVRMFKNDPERYDLIFMDIQMPNLNGHEATRQIRSMDIAKAKEIPIIAMTAAVFKEDVDICVEAGMNDHIGKPIILGEMLEKLRRYL